MSIGVSCYDAVLQSGEMNEGVSYVLVFCGVLWIWGVSGWDVDVGYMKVFVL